MHTQSDALAHITEAIQATGVIPDAAAEYDLDSIAYDLHTAAGETWDLENLDTGIFWWIVQRHALTTEEPPVAPAEPNTPTPASDEIANTLADAAAQVADTRGALKAAEATRDQLLARAHRTGAYTITDLAGIAGLTRGRVSQILS